MKQVKHTAKDVVVLAAGYGSRLSDYNNGTAVSSRKNGTSNNGHVNNLKPLTPVAGVPLIFRTLDNLENAGVQNAYIVVGYKGEVLKEKVRNYYQGNLNLYFVKNEEYDLSNGVSLLKVKQYFDRPFILAMADHIFSSEMARLAGSHIPMSDGATLLVDYKVDSIFDMDDATKVLADDETLIDIGKKIPDYNCIDTGIFVATPALFTHLKRIYDQSGDVSLSQGVKSLANEDRMKILDIKNAFWQDVDTPEMLKYAEWVVRQDEEFQQNYKKRIRIEE